MTVENHIKILCGFQRPSKRLISALIAFLEMEIYINKKVCELSAGNKRKLSLILALL